MYSDALHAQVITSAVGKDLGLDERYQAAAGVYARLGAAVNATYNMIAHLVRDGLLDLDKAVFTERMLAETSIDMPMVGGYSAPVGSAPMPSDMSDTSELDPKVWRPIWEEFEEIIEARKKTRRHTAARSAGVRAGYRSAGPTQRSTARTRLTTADIRADDGNRTRVFSLGSCFDASTLVR